MRSSSPFPREGANDDFHINMIKGLCLGDEKAFPWYTGDPDWDMTYMSEGGKNWLEVAPHWLPVPTDGVKKNKKKLFPKKKTPSHTPRHTPTPCPTAPPIYTPPMSTSLYPNLDTSMEAVIAAYMRQHPPAPPPAPTPPPPPPPAPVARQGQAAAAVVPSPAVTRSRHTNTLRHEPETTTEGAYPFLTVGDQLVMKALTPSELKDIIKGAPNPRTNPSACMMYLKRMCQGQCMTQTDIRLVIDGLLDFDPESGWDWMNVPTINTPDTNNTTTAYALATTAGINAMWDEIRVEM